MKIFLNLLPPELKRQMVKRFYWRYFLGQWFLVFLLSLLVLTCLLALYVRVEFEGKQAVLEDASQASGSYQKEYQGYQEKFEATNKTLKSTAGFLTLHTSFSSLLQQIEEAVPPNTKIEKISTQSYKVFVTGNTDNRDTFLRFQENIKNNSCFEAVNNPLSNIFSETNVHFEIDFVVKQDCIRGTTPKL